MREGGQEKGVVQVFLGRRLVERNLSMRDSATLRHPDWLP